MPTDPECLNAGNLFGVVVLGGFWLVGGLALLAVTVTLYVIGRRDERR